MSQEMLANKSDLDRSNISRLERGHYAPTLTILFMLSKALDMSVEEFVSKIKSLLKFLPYGILSISKNVGMAFQHHTYILQEVLFNQHSSS